MGKRPDLSSAVKFGEPTLVDPKETDAPCLVREINDAVKTDIEAKSKSGSGKISVETVKPGDKAPENQPAPHSAETAVNPTDIPVKAPSQLNESSLSTSTDKPANAVESSSTTDKGKGDKDAASSRKKKKTPLASPDTPIVRSQSWNLARPK